MVPSIHIDLTYGQLTLTVIAIVLISGVLARLLLYWRWQEVALAEDYVVECDRRNRQLFAWVIDTVDDPAIEASIPADLVATRPFLGAKARRAAAMAAGVPDWLSKLRADQSGRHRAGLGSVTS
jgi:hypothetical protein